MLAWLLAVFVVVGVPTLARWIDLSAVWSRRLAADVAITVLTVVPFLAYLVVTEHGPAHATLGKRRAGLVVTSVDGSVAGGRGVVVRNVVKVLPWQLGHMAAARFASGTVGATAVVCYVLSLLLLGLIVGPVLARRRGLHDLLAATTVVRR